MTVSAQIKAAVIAAYGGQKSVRALADEHGLTPGQVTGIFHRRPRGTPEEEAARIAARDAAEAAESDHAPEPEGGGATPAPWSPETALFVGQQGTVWATLLAAGPAGATAEAMLARIYPDGDRPGAAADNLKGILSRLRKAVATHDHGVALVDGASPTRWRIRRPGEVAPEAPACPDSAPPPGPAEPEGKHLPAPIASPPAPIACTAGAPITLAEAFALLTPAACRWPIGELQEPGFRFCCARVHAEGKPYCAEHARAAAGGTWNTRRTA